MDLTLVRAPCKLCTWVYQLDVNEYRGEENYSCWCEELVCLSNSKHFFLEALTDGVIANPNAQQRIA